MSEAKQLLISEFENKLRCQMDCLLDSIVANTSPSIWFGEIRTTHAALQLAKGIVEPEATDEAEPAKVPTPTEIDCPF